MQGKKGKDSGDVAASDIPVIRTVPSLKTFAFTGEPKEVKHKKHVNNEQQVKMLPSHDRS